LVCPALKLLQWLMNDIDDVGDDDDRNFDHFLEVTV